MSPTQFENLEFTRIHDFDESFDTLWQRIRSHHNFLIVRDRPYLRWRFIDHPEKPAIVFSIHHGKSLEGYLVLHITSDPYGRVGVIEDLVITSQEWLEPVFVFAETWLRKAGCDTIHFYFAGIPKTIPLLKQMGFQCGHARNSLVIKFYHPLIDEKIIRHYESWYLTTSEIYFA